MSISIYILHKVLVKEFYRLNTGFFFVVIALAFGFLRDAEHMALAQFFISSPTLMVIPISVWFIYTIKILRFNQEALQKRGNEFLGNFHLLTSGYWSALLVASILQLIPAIAYGTFLLLIAVKYQQLVAVTIVIAALCSMMGTCCWFLSFELKSPNREKKVSAFKRLLDMRITKPYTQFFIEWIARRDLATLFGSKLFSCILIFGITKLYVTDTYDWRLLGLGTAIAFSGNMMLVFHYHRFENFHFPITRNMPFSLFRRLANFILVIAFLNLPEFGLLIKNFPDQLTLPNLIQFILFSLSINAIFYATLFIKDIDLEQFMQKGFPMILLWIVLILFSIPLWIIASINMTFGIILFRKYYYSFEFIASVDSEK